MKKETKAQDEPKNELMVVREKIVGMKAAVEKIVVNSQETLAEASNIIKSVKDMAKAIKAKKDKYAEPAKAIIAEARETYDPLLKECESAEIVLKQKAGRYMQQEEAKRLEAERKLAARVEKGTLKPETAAAKLEAIPEAPKTVRTDQGAGLRMAKHKVAKIINVDLIPDEFWVVDEVRVRREALDREKYGKEPIPGVAIEEVASMSSV